MTNHQRPSSGDGRKSPSFSFTCGDAIYSTSGGANVSARQALSYIPEDYGRDRQLLASARLERDMWMAKARAAIERRRQTMWVACAVNFALVLVILWMGR